MGGGKQPSKIQVRPPIQIKLVLEDLPYRLRGGAISGNPKLWDILLASVARGIGRHARDDVLGVDVLLPALLGVAAELFDDGVGVDLLPQFHC